MPRWRRLCQTAALAVLLAGCTRVVERPVLVQQAVVQSTTTTSTSTSTSSTSTTVVPYNWKPTGVPTPPNSRTISAAAAWVGAAERRWTDILGFYETFITGQVANSQGQRNDCDFAFDRFQADRALFSPIPAGVSISDANRQLIELVLGRIESNARICLAGHIGDFGQDKMTKEEAELVQIAQALDAVGADR